MLLYCCLVQKGIVLFTGTQGRYTILAQDKIDE